MAKQDEHRFNLRFDEDDENHRRVSAYLNQCGRKKARYIVKAVLAYWELQDGRIPVVEGLPIICLAVTLISSFVIWMNRAEA